MFLLLVVNIQIADLFRFYWKEIDVFNRVGNEENDTKSPLDQTRKSAIFVKREGARDVNTIRIIIFYVEQRNNQNNCLCFVLYIEAELISILINLP